MSMKSITKICFNCLVHYFRRHECNVCHLHEPFLKRVSNRHFIRNLFFVTLGMAITFFGSWLATMHVSFIPDGIWHGIGYCIHAVGFVPVIQRIEPVWRTIMGPGAAAEVEEALASVA